MTNPIQGSATVAPVPPRLPPAVATWVVDEVAKTSSAAMFGGVLTIRRRDDTGKFAGEFKLERVPEGDDPGANVLLKLALKECETLFDAQQRGEVRVRESLSKTHPELLTAAEEADAAERRASAKPDPF